MAQQEVKKLDSRDECPALEFDLVGGGRQSLPTGKWTVALFYRGVW